MSAAPVVTLAEPFCEVRAHGAVGGVRADAHAVRHGRQSIAPRPQRRRCGEGLRPPSWDNSRSRSAGSSNSSPASGAGTGGGGTGMGQAPGLARGVRPGARAQAGPRWAVGASRVRRPGRRPADPQGSRRLRAPRSRLGRRSIAGCAGRRRGTGPPSRWGAGPCPLPPRPSSRRLGTVSGPPMRRTTRCHWFTRSAAAFRTSSAGSGRGQTVGCGGCECALCLGPAQHRRHVVAQLTPRDGLHSLSLHQAHSDEDIAEAHLGVLLLDSQRRSEVGQAQRPAADKAHSQRGPGGRMLHGADPAVAEQDVTSGPGPTILRREPLAPLAASVRSSAATSIPSHRSRGPRVESRGPAGRL